jgi:uncharacterized membrane protein
VQIVLIWSVASIFCVPVVLVVGWFYFSSRLRAVDSRIEDLSDRVAAHDRTLMDALFARPEVKTAAASPAPPPAPEPEPLAVEPRFPSPPAAPRPRPVEVLAIPQPPLESLPSFAQVAPERSTEEWETLLGGNWLNKIGVFVLVVGIALALGYSFTRVGPMGRVSTGIAVSLAMLAAGAVLEPRDRYCTFARGLLGGGWAALYTTVFAMHAMEAARVIQSPVTGFFLLLAVAAGIIAHSLRYRSQTVTGVAYFVAFGTLAITQGTGLPVLALIPLICTLLYVAHRFSWPRLALLGLLSTYAICVLRGDAAAGLWQAQAIIAIFWLLFEVFDILHPEAWLLPLNAVGFLGISLLKWHAADPGRLWILLAATAAAYLPSALARWRSRNWQGAATLTAALTAAALFQKLDHQWIASALVVEAELCYLAGIRLRAPYLRWLGTSLFGLELGRLLVNDVADLPLAAWAPVASLDAVVFYANRALRRADTFYGFAGAAMMALVFGAEASEPYRTVAWLLFAGGTFVFGWWRRLFDFRLQAYFLGLLGVTAALAQTFAWPLALAAALAYAVALSVLRSAPDRFAEEEGHVVCLSASIASTAACVALLWRLAPSEYLGLSWLALSLVLLELGLRNIPLHFRRLALAVAILGASTLGLFNLPELHNSGPWIPRLVPLAAALLAYAIAVGTRREKNWKAFAVAFSAGTALLLVAAWALLPPAAVAPAWAGITLALVLMRTGSPTELATFRVAGYVVAAGAFARCWWFNLEQQGPGSGFAASVATALVISGLYAAQFLTLRGSRSRLYFSLLATCLTSLLLYYRISGSLWTVAWGMQGLALLASGFPLRDRTLRLSGLTLLLSCILKLFLWDLRHLETFPRIFSFIVLGLILLGVSWVYTRFRDRVARYL